MGPKNTSALLARLRELMKSSTCAPQALHAYIIPTDDEHQSEYIAECDKRREYITGFTGSAGTAIVTENHAALWTDGRYYLQAESQLDENWILMRDGLKGTLTKAEWLKKVLEPGCTVGVDSKLLAAASWGPFERELEEDDLHVCASHQNLIDVVWDQSRPPAPSNHVFVQPMEFAGQTWQDKIAEVRKKMIEKQVKVMVVTALDDVAWLFNLRGNDIMYNPVFFGYAIVTMKEVMLFVDESKLTTDVLKHLGQGTESCVEIKPYNEVQTALQDIVENEEGKIWVADNSSYALFSIVPKKRRISSQTPIALMKSVKNAVEIEGMKNSHIKDAVALCEFFCWLEQEVPKGDVTEISASDKVLEFRRQQKHFISPSFDTISAVGANGAIIHYKPTKETNSRLAMDKMYLCDSGAQFRDGTTDVTRTIHYGTPDKREQENFTRVLKGHIRLAQLVFPNGVKGSLLDSFARASLWEAGLDYLHGTGHGVGSFLACHEGPCGISYKVRPNEVALEAGMILSDEPGYYEDNHYGIRIESLLLVKEAKTKHNFKHKGFLCFEPVTLFPIQQNLIIPNMLSEQEVAWLNDYHQRCLEVVGAELKKQKKMEALQWLERQTTPLG